MVKKTILVLATSFVVLLCACSSNFNLSKNDDDFIKNLQKGLEDRWDISKNSPESFESNAAKKEQYAKCVNAELDRIGVISDYSFENEELQSLAETYYNALQSQIDGLKYLGVDDNKYNQIYIQNGYYNRARVLYTLVNSYGLSFSNDYSAEIDDFVSLGLVLHEANDQVEAMKSIFNENITIESLGSSDYQCVIMNNTEYDLSNAKIEFNLYNDDNVLVESENMKSWLPGSRNQCTLYIRNSFSKAKARITVYSDSIGDYLSTEYLPVELVNNMTIDISLTTSLPAEISYSSYGSIKTECAVTDFKYEIGYWNDGTASVTLKVSGLKTYDERGDSYSRSVKIGWKLYDKDENVVDSGTINSSGIRVGESFTDAADKVYNLAPGSYKLIILNVS